MVSSCSMKPTSLGRFNDCRQLWQGPTRFTTFTNRSTLGRNCPTSTGFTTNLIRTVSWSPLQNCCTRGHMDRISISTLTYLHVFPRSSRDIATVSFQILSFNHSINFSFQLKPSNVVPTEEINQTKIEKWYTFFYFFNLEIQFRSPLLKRQYYKV
jgi:hypothetical protein